MLEGARVFHNAAQVTVSGVPLTLAFNSERYDTDFIHNIAINNSRLTCTKSGIYTIGVNVEWNAALGLQHNVSIRLNGGNDIAREYGRGVAAPGHLVAINVNCIYQLTLGDFVEVVVLQNDAVNENINVVANFSPEFWMHRIG